jgi:NitT/TauT family transport system substrate-binding protein
MHRISRSQLIAGGSAALVAMPRLAGSQQLEKIRFAGVPTDDLAPVFWGIAKGSYAKVGLEVEFIPTGSGTTATTAVISGAYEMAKSSQIAAMVAFLKGVPVVIVGNGALWESNNAWALGVVAADSPIKTAADLNGKIIGAAGLNDLSSLAINAWVDKNGGDSKTLKWVEIPGSAAGAATAEHRIAACQLNEPQLRAALETKQVKVFAKFLDAISPMFVSTVLLARPEWARANRGIVDKFVRTTYETGRYTNAHPAETAPVVAEITKIPLDVIQKMTRAHFASSSDPGLIQSSIDAAAKYGQISRAFPAREIYLT